jgi:PIN domain nuclease of toxin-antitoxin system
MSYLVDTHYLLWSLFAPKKIGKKVKKIFENVEVAKHVSKISFWEISLKYSLGKIELSGIEPDDLVRETIEAGFHVYDIGAEDLASFHRLPKQDGHKDPFDRMLIWQCIRNNLILITADRRIKEYDKYGLQTAGVE